MSSASLAQSLRYTSWGGTSWVAKSMTAGLPPTPTPTLCAPNWSSNQLAVRGKKKKKTACPDSAPFAQKHGENIWKSWQQPCYFCHWSTLAGGGRMAEGFVTARGERATRRCERRPLPSTNLVSNLSLPRCLDTSTKGGFPVTISTYSTVIPPNMTPFLIGYRPWKQHITVPNLDLIWLNDPYL